MKELAATPKTQAAEAPRRLVALRLALYCCLLCAAFVFFSLELEGYTWGYAFALRSALSFQLTER